jgi:hypothetical protein
MTTVIEFLQQLQPSAVSQSYFGRQGCACGCGGNYHETPKMARQAINKILKWLDERDGDMGSLDDAQHVDMLGWQNRSGGYEYCIGLEWETPSGTGRAIRIYTKSETRFPFASFR